MKSISESLPVSAPTMAPDKQDTTNIATSSRHKNCSALSAPPQPWGTQFLDLLRLLSPRTWYGLALNAKISPFVPAIDWSPLVEGFKGLLLPWAIAALLISSVGQQHNPRLLSLSRLYLASPWTCHCFLGTMGQPFRQLLQMGVQYRQLRSEPLPEAVETMRELVDQQRAIRKRRYDLFLPPKTLQPQPRAILFVPGAAVPTIAYAPIAAQLADAGFLVVVPSMEPMRFAMKHLGAEWSSIRRIMRSVERYLGQNCEWILAGHSMGSFAAMQLFGTKPNNSPLKIAPQLVLWGTMYAPSYSLCLQDLPVQLLLIQGDHDALLDMTAPWKDEFEREYLPKQYTGVILPGGTHHGFSSYQSTVADQPSDLARETQQAMACQESIQFLQKEQMVNKK